VGVGSPIYETQPRAESVRYRLFPHRRLVDHQGCPLCPGGSRLLHAHRGSCLESFPAMRLSLPNLEGEAVNPALCLFRSCSCLGAAGAGFAPSAENGVRANLKRLFPHELFCLLETRSEPGNVIPEIDGEATWVCTWETYGGAILLYDGKQNLCSYLAIGKIREAWLEGLDGDGVMEIVARCGPWSATGYRLDALQVLGWRNRRLEKLAEFVEYEGVYARTLGVPYEDIRDPDDIIRYLRKTGMEQGLDAFEKDELLGE